MLLVSDDFVGRVQGGAARGQETNRERSLLSKGAFCDCLSMIFWVVSQSLQNGLPPDLSLHIEIGVLQ